MQSGGRFGVRLTALACWVVLLQFNPCAAQDLEPGRSIGKVSTKGDLIVLELEDGALGAANLFDLVGRTLRFTPEGAGYRVENSALRWDPGFGAALSGVEVTLGQFAFPFSGRRWRSFRVGATGSIVFGSAGDELDPYGHRDGGISIGRFDRLAEAAGALIDRAPAICVFLKPRLSGSRFVKELPDRVVVTWDLTEPFGGLLDFGWDKTVNRFQAVLHRDGSIEMSYKELAAKDAIVGLYPALVGRTKLLATIASAPHAALPPHLDLQRVQLSIQDDVLLRVRLETRGPVPAEGDRASEGVQYRIDFRADSPRRGLSGPDLRWTVAGMAEPDNPRGVPVRYIASGSGVFPGVKVAGNTITVEGVVPEALRGSDRVAVQVEVTTGGDHATVVEHLPPRTVRWPGMRASAVHLSAVTRKDGPFAAVYEAFHYPAPPRPQDLSCTILQALGDRFDFLAYYSDFRIDSQEASTPSEGPLGGKVAGIEQPEIDPRPYCTQGRLQLELAQPIYVDANEMQEAPPPGAPVGSPHDITFYVEQLEKASPQGLLSYNYAVGHLGHEVGHRWAAYVSAKVAGVATPLGPWPHWGPGLQAPVAFPYSLPIEASTMGGGVWQDNLDGTYTLRRDGFFVPATGYSHLDLYLMGLISTAEVPDFFLLENLVPVGKDAGGHPIFKADRTKVTIADVIAAEGPRLPDSDHSQREFNTGIVLIVEHGQSPSRNLTERADGIRRRWIDYWSTATGHRASMTATPR